MLLADRNFAVCDLVEQIHATGADLLIRCKTSRRLPTIGRYQDGSRLALLGTVVRVIDAEITVHTDGKPHHTGQYRLISPTPQLRGIAADT